MSSAFPRPIEQLIPQAERLSRELGRLPSQNQLKAALHVRAERAKAVLHVLKETGFDPTAPEPDERQPRRLHSVPESQPDESRAEPSGDHTGSPLVDSETARPEAVPAPESGGVSGDTNPGRSVPFNGAGELVPSPRSVRRWPIVLLAAPAFVAIWSAWVGVGELAGFGPVRPLPGIADGFTINSAITLPIGMETYAAYAVRVWLADGSSGRARRFAKYSAIAAFVLGGLGQIAYHLMTAAHMTAAPWPVTTAVSCLPVVVLGFGAALVHLQREGMEGTR